MRSTVTNRSMNISKLIHFWRISAKIQHGASVREWFVLPLVLLSCFKGAGLAQSPTLETWTNADGTGNWSDGNNWSPPTNSGGPNGNFNVSIPSGGPAMDVSASIVNLQMAETTGINIAGGNQLTITGTSIANDGTLNVGVTTSGTLNISGAVTLSGTGEVQMESTSSSIIGGGTLTNQQTITGTGTISVSLVNEGPNGEIYGTDSSNPLMFTGPVTNSGLIATQEFGQIEFVNDTVQNAGGTITGGVGTAWLNACTIVGGTIGSASAVPVAAEDAAVKNRTLRGRHAPVALPSTPPPGPTLNGVTITGLYLVSSGNDQTNGTTLVGNITNNGTIQVAGSSELYIPGAVAVGGTGEVNVNEGTVNQAPSLTGPGTLTNQETINISLGQLSVSEFINQGTVNAADGLNVQVTTFNNTNGVFNVTTGTVTLTGGAFTNGNIVVSSGATLQWESGVTLSGVDFSGGGTVIAVLATLNGLIAVDTVEIIIIIEDDGQLTLEGSLILSPNGIIFLDSDLGGFAILVIDGTVDINGTGGITASNSPNNKVNAGAAKKNALTINVPNFTGSGVIGDGTFPITIGAHTTVINNGAQPLIFDVGNNSFKNLGTLETSASGDIEIVGKFANYNLTTNTLTGGTYIIDGILQFDNANIINNAAKLTLSAGGQILNLNGGANGLANFSNNTAKGTFQLTGGEAFESSGTLNNEGAVIISQGSSLTIGGTSTNYNQSGTAAVTTVDGELAVPAGGLTNITGGTLQASGLFNGDVSVGNASGAAATFIVGDSKKSSAQVTMSNTYTQLATGAMGVQIGGTTAGSDYSQLNVTDAVNLGGTLNLATINKFKPTSGDNFTIVNAPSGVTGTFATVKGAPPNSTVVYELTSVKLEVH